VRKANAEVLVLRDHDPLIGLRLPENRRVTRPPQRFLYGQYIVPAAAQLLNDCRRNILVGDETHGILDLGGYEKDPF
jgi:hypothetical protein